VSIDRGIDRASARASLIEDFGLDRDARLVGFVANLFRRKRPFYFLDVCVHLARHVENFHGIVFGRAGDFEPAELRAYAEAVGLGSRVTFAGFRLPPGRNIAALDLLLAPALDEPFGLTLVEALLLGVPYVATSGEGHIEIHGCWKGGRLVPDSADPLEFAATALDVLKDPSRVVLGQAQRMKARQELSPKRHVDDVVRVYEQVMARRTNPAIGVRHY
jgi:glycosyltransferase involved in cell wall biosynthesis